MSEPKPDKAARKASAADKDAARRASAADKGAARKASAADKDAARRASAVDKDAARRASAAGVSVFFPCYNDWGTMGSMIMLTERALRLSRMDGDITIVDDGSGEHTQALLEEIARVFPDVRIVHHPSNRGYGGALRSGFASATREWIFYTDGDAQYDVRELEVLLGHAGPDVDIVQGYKIARGDPLYRRIVGRVYHWGVKIAFGLPYRDVDCDFRLIRRSVFDKIKLTRNSGVICVEMMAKIHRAGFRHVEAAVHHHERAHGKSQFFNFPRIARTLWQLAGLWVQIVLLRREG